MGQKGRVQGTEQTIGRARGGGGGAVLGEVLSCEVLSQEDEGVAEGGCRRGIEL